MLRSLAFFAALFLAAPAMADEQSAFLGKALAELQQQRNTAMDEAVNARAQLALALQRIAELEKRAENKEAPK